MTSDDPLALYRKTMATNLAPNIFDGVTVFRGIVLYVFPIPKEMWSLSRLLPSFLNLPMVAGRKVNFFSCMIPELHAHLPNPYTSVSKSAEDFIKKLELFPIFEPTGISSVEYSKLESTNAGSIVEIQFSDPNRTHGYVSRAINILDSGIVPTIEISATGAFGSGNPEHISPPGDYGEGALNIPGVQAKPGVKGPISEALQKFLEICGRIASEQNLPQPVVTSGYRSPDDQISAMASNWVSNGGLHGGNQYLLKLYRDDAMASAIGSIFTSNYDRASDRVSPDGRKEATAYWTQRYGTGSRSHLKVPAEAVDLRKTEGILDIINEAIAEMASHGIQVASLDEPIPPHFHITFEGESVPSESPNTSNEQDIYPDDDFPTSAT
jgi:hypothetical protein